MLKKKVLFVCIHNSARSQMAEELLNKMAGDQFQAESAGLTPGTLNPVVVKILKEDEGIDISGKATQDVFELFKQGRLYQYVITVCDEAAAERCPIFPNALERIHWSFSDPSQFSGSDKEKIQKTKQVKEEIKKKLEEWIGALKD